MTDAGFSKDKELTKNNNDSNKPHNDKQTYYNIDDAVNCVIQSETPYIIANDRLKLNGTLGRYFKVFKSFDAFMQKRLLYVNSHEILLNHSVVKNKLSHGRLVFDFDIDKKYGANNNFVPDTFEDDIEECVMATIMRYYRKVNLTIIEFVWSTSPNANKYSKHLTVKNFCFSNWVEMCKLFYKLFKHMWDDETKNTSSELINGVNLIDFQVVRKSASLRMVGSCKINGSVLTLDNKTKYNLVDSLIRPIDISNEQLVTCANHRLNLISSDLEIELDEENNNNGVTTIKTKLTTLNNTSGILPAEFPLAVYAKGFDMINALTPDIFTKGKINGVYLTLLRSKEGCCILSGKIHERENSFIQLTRVKPHKYNVYFGCYRGCQQSKPAFIGTVYIDEGNDNALLDNCIDDKILFRYSTDSERDEDHEGMSDEEIEVTSKSITKPVIDDQINKLNAETLNYAYKFDPNFDPSAFKVPSLKKAQKKVSIVKKLERSLKMTFSVSGSRMLDLTNLNLN